MQGQESWTIAVRDALEPHARKLRKHLRNARRGKADAVHDARTTLRRLREGLFVLGESVCRPGVINPLEGGLHDIERALGPTRDDDVLLEDIERWCAAHRRADLKKVAGTLRRCRKKDGRRVTRELGRKRVKKVRKRMARFLDGLDDSRDPASPKAHPSLVGHFLGEQTWRAYADILAFETHDRSDPDVIHKVRAACRRLRYRLELFDGALPKRRVNPTIAALRSMQERFGELHDCVIALGRIDAWIASDKVTRTKALDRYLAAKRRTRNRLETEFHETWRSLIGEGFRHRIALLSESRV